MAKLVWNEPDKKLFESGLDRGVLYLQGPSVNWPGVAWNGLISVNKTSGRAITPVHFDAQVVSNTVSMGAFSGSLTAMTYPDEFATYEGDLELRSGVYLTDQMPKVFCLSYRTLIGDGILGVEAGYKLHIVYNLMAVPQDKEYTTHSENPEAMELSWDLAAVPPSALGHRPTAHIILDSTRINSSLLRTVETIIYGDAAMPAYLPPFEELMSILTAFFALTIVDNGDGTWDAIVHPDYEGEYIEFLPDDEFRIDNANAIYIDAETYEISDSL